MLGSPCSSGSCEDTSWHTMGKTQISEPPPGRHPVESQTHNGLFTQVINKPLYCYALIFPICYKASPSLSWPTESYCKTSKYLLNLFPSVVYKLKLQRSWEHNGLWYISRDLPHCELLYKLSNSTQHRFSKSLLQSRCHVRHRSDINKQRLYPSTVQSFCVNHCAWSPCIKGGKAGHGKSTAEEEKKQT